MKKIIGALGLVVFAMLVAALALVVSTQGTAEYNARPFGAVVSDKMMPGQWHE